MSEKKLLSCPFCGGEATIHCNKVLSKGEYKRIYGVMCKKPYCCYIPPKYYTKEEAIEKWNTRVPMQKIVERLEEEREKSLDRFIGGRCNGKTLQMGINCGIDKAIEIVKEGGLDV